LSCPPPRSLRGDWSYVENCRSFGFLASQKCHGTMQKNH
jgi:hypothetical protein